MFSYSSVDNLQNKFEFQIQSYTIIVTLIMIVGCIIIEHEKQIYVIVTIRKKLHCL